MTGCFGVKRNFLLNVILDTLEHTKKFNGVEDTKMSYSGTILSISKERFKIKQ